MAEGEFKDLSDAINTAIIQWLRDREKGLLAPGAGLGERVRREILEALRKKELTMLEISAVLEEKGLRPGSREILSYHLSFLEKMNEIEKIGDKYCIKTG